MEERENQYVISNQCYTNKLDLTKGTLMPYSCQNIYEPDQETGTAIKLTEMGVQAEP